MYRSQAVTFDQHAHRILIFLISIRAPPRSQFRCVQAHRVIDELRRVSDYIKAMHEMHGDQAAGSHIAQERIERAIKKITRDMERAANHDSTEIDDAVAAFYTNLW